MTEETTLEEVIQDALVPDGGVLTKYVICAEYDDGTERWLVVDGSDGLTEWDRTGLLAVAMNSEDF